MENASGQTKTEFVKWRKISLYSSLILGLCILLAFSIWAVYQHIEDANSPADDLQYFGSALVIVFILYVPIPILIITGIAWRWPLAGAIISFTLACLMYSPIIEYNTIDSVFIYIGIIFGSLFLIIGSLNIKVWQIKKKGI